MNHAFDLNVTNSEERLDVLVLRELRKSAPQFTRATVRELFGQSRILMEGRATPPSMRPSPGTYRIEVLDFAFESESRKARPSFRGSFLPVIYEDDEILVLHKTSGVPSVPHSSEETETAVGAALARFPDLPSRERHELEPGLLHRLDTQTSGILAFAKTADEFLRLRTLWKERKVDKIYRAIAVPRASGTPLPDVIEWPLAHDAKQAKRMRALGPMLPRAEIRGKPLPAHTRILASHEIGGAKDLEISIVTGVMHQIRCHLSSAGWPIAGDPVYGGSPASRLWLHSWKLGFPLASGQFLRLEAALPENWPKHWPE